MQKIKYTATGYPAHISLGWIMGFQPAGRLCCLPGRNPDFRRFQHQTPFSEGGRGSPVWVKLSIWLNPRVSKKIFVEVMTMWWYIYYDAVFVCLCVTKNHHFLKLLMCNDVQWCVMMCDNVRWCVMMCDNMQWCVMMCDDVWSWCAIMCYKQFPIQAERRRRKVRRW